MENVGAQLVKEVASKTSDVAGDGTHHGNGTGAGHLPRGREDSCGRSKSHGPEARH